MIDWLRKEYGGTWKYNQQTYCWETDRFYVYKEAASAPRYDGDDETFVTHWRRSDTYEQLYPPGSWGFLR